MFKTTVKIDGMMCEKCEAHTVEAIKKAFADSKKVSASHTAKEATFLTNDRPDETAVTAAVEEAGYSFVSCESEPYSGGFLSGLFKK